MTKLFTPAGAQIVGTKEIIPGMAQATSYSADGEPIYDGGTTIWWDDQKTVWEKGSRVYLDENGGEWAFAQLTPGADEEKS